MMLVKKDKEMEKEIERVIREYLEETFHNKDAIPNVMVEGLAKAIAKDKKILYLTIIK